MVFRRHGPIIAARPTASNADPDPKSRLLARGFHATRHSDDERRRHYGALLAFAWEEWSASATWALLPLPQRSGPVSLVSEPRYRDSSNSQVSGPSSEEPGTAPFVKEQQSRTALLLVVRSRRR
ncbi:MAG: hypothetical protein ACXVHK_32400, partial [Solirubrobacteraceae bacterium]